MVPCSTKPTVHAVVGILVDHSPLFNATFTIRGLESSWMETSFWSKCRIQFYIKQNVISNLVDAAGSSTRSEFGR